MSALILEHVEVGESHVEARVLVAEDAPLRTSAVPGLPAAALALLPGLARHRCECGSARGIAAELARTETPHLLEHIALELMALSGSPRQLAGRTSWDFEGGGPRVFVVRLDFDDDLVAVGALSAGVRVVDGLLGIAPAPDLASEVETLRSLRSR